MTRLVSLIVCALVLQPALASAQDAPSIAPGSRVRLSTSVGDRFTGTVLSLDATYITFMSDDAKVPIAMGRGSITRLEVSLGRGSRGKTARKGALIGAVLGVVLGFAAGDDRNNSIFSSAGGKALALGLLMAPLGAISGALAGQERWAPTTPGPAYAVQTRAGRAASLQFSVRF